MTQVLSILIKFAYLISMAIVCFQITFQDIFRHLPRQVTWFNKWVKYFQLAFFTMFENFVFWNNFCAVALLIFTTHFYKECTPLELPPGIKTRFLIFRDTCLIDLLSFLYLWYLLSFLKNTVRKHFKILCDMS